MEQKLPKVGDQLFLSQITGDDYVDMVKIPYTVIAVNNKCITIQSAKCIFPEKRHYDTLALDIIEDKEGVIKKLYFSKNKNRWQHKCYKGDTYPYYAFFGKYEYFPYLN